MSLVDAESALRRAAKPALSTIRIQPESGWRILKLREIWEARELLFVLAWRDVKVRYRQTALGFTWVIGAPVLTMVVFTVVFGGIAKLPSDNLPYPIFAYSGLLPWTYFSQAINRGGVSLVTSSALVSKVYFPRAIVPLAAILTPVADFVFSAFVLVGLMVWYDIGPGWGALMLPVFFLVSMLTALAVAVWLSAINVKYRDITFVIPFLVQFWMYLSPIIYPVKLIPGPFRPFYNLNPMVGVIDGFRWGLLGKQAPDFASFGTSCAIVLVVLLTGLVYFRRVERTLTDLL
jgi:lipopolysaccharide transport system permease protein